MAIHIERNAILNNLNMNGSVLYIFYTIYTDFFIYLKKYFTYK